MMAWWPYHNDTLHSLEKFILVHTEITSFRVGNMGKRKQYIKSHFSKSNMWKLKGIRICHPQICYFGIRIISSWRQLRINRCRNRSLPSAFLPKSRAKISLCEGVPFSFQEEERNSSPEMESWHWGESA